MALLSDRGHHPVRLEYPNSSNTLAGNIPNETLTAALVCEAG
jgi:hypothetical protein